MVSLNCEFCKFPITHFNLVVTMQGDAPTEGRKLYSGACRTCKAQYNVVVIVMDRPKISEKEIHRLANKPSGG